MTAEIAILNRQGVALAADSAVTIGGFGHPKVYNSVNKLFMLSRRAPVGIMIYGNAELTGVPWETIVKVYRRELGEQRFPHLQDYAANLILFLDRQNSLFPDGQQKLQLLSSVYALYTRILAQIDKAIKEALALGPLTSREITSLVTITINREHAPWKAGQFLDGRSQAYADGVLGKWKAQIDDIRGKVFQNLPLSAISRKRLREIAGWLFAKNLFPAGISGIVVAGFGEAEHYPSCFSYNTEGVVLDALKVEARQAHTIEVNDPVAIMPFAQIDMVQMFMEGVDRRMRETIDSALERFVDGLPNAILGPLGLPAVAMRTTRRQLEVASKTLLQQFKDQVAGHSSSRHVSPIIDSVAMLPKEELAALAESLITLTSLRRRVTMDVETVGGPIDVAVISKGDGFIWIRRKHYFDAKLNHHFFDNYYG